MSTPRRTKIVATLGPATDGPGVLRELVRTGLDVARLNFSHGTAEEHASRAAALRRHAREAGREVAILADLPGPKLRLGRFRGNVPVRLARGARVTLTARRVEGNEGLLPVEHPALTRDLRAGQSVVLADGAIRLVAVRVGRHEVTCRVVNGGLVHSRAGVHFPDARVTAANPTREDLVHARHAVELGADWIALSFVQSPDEVVRLGRHLAKLGARARIIAKIEKPQALERLEEILEAAGGAMVARGDLGIECPLPQVPLAQKRIIREANRAERPVITATQMLESMIESPVPTRAEVTDVANAILDGTDAVMLSAETAIGKHPVEAVRAMASIALTVETSAEARSAEDALREEVVDVGDVTESLARAARHAAEHSGARAIIVHSTSGLTAIRVARQRPRAPVLALCANVRTLRMLQLAGSVHARHLPAVRTTDRLLAAGLRRARELGFAGRGDLVVTVAGANSPGSASHVLKLVRIP